MRCGVSASAPFRRFRSASYSLKFPSNHTAWVLFRPVAPATFAHYCR
jgi:hypothetical protein